MDYQPKLLKCGFGTLLGSLIVVALLALPGRAGANTFAYGTIGPIAGPALLGIGSGGHSTLGAFTDTWTFTVAPANSFFLGMEVVPGNSYGVTFSSVDITGAGLYGPFAFANTTDFSVPLSPTLLAPGAYTATVTGNTTIANGFYNAAVNFNNSLAPIPEPETYAMMLAGLGLMGFVARRRRQKDAV